MIKCYLFSLIFTAKIVLFQEFQTFRFSKCPYCLIFFIGVVRKAILSRNYCL